MQTMPTSRTCPKCGHELLIKSGRNGQFIGCSNYPGCRYSSNVDGSKTKFAKEVTEWDEQGNPTQISNTIVVPVRKPTVCPFKKCDGSGKVPFLKEGNIIPNAFIFCECSPYSNPDKDAHFRETHPEDIDYPVSYSHYRALCQYHGWADPGDDTLPPVPEKPATLPPGATQGQLEGALEHLKGQTNWLQNKVKSLEAKKAKTYEHYNPF